jgi:hypothetical protein
MARIRDDAEVDLDALGFSQVDLDRLLVPAMMLMIRRPTGHAAVQDG